VTPPAQLGLEVLAEQGGDPATAITGFHWPIHSVSDASWAFIHYPSSIIHHPLSIIHHLIHSADLILNPPWVMCR
jgi:hypothetical protein